MTYDWDGRRTRRMNMIQSIVIGAVIFLGSTFFAAAIVMD